MLGALLKGCPTALQPRAEEGLAQLRARGRGACSTGNWHWALLGAGSWAQGHDGVPVGTTLAKSSCTDLVLGERAVLPVSPHPILTVETEARGAQSQQGTLSAPHPGQGCWHLGPASPYTQLPSQASDREPAHQSLRV